jgi:hypothetical protein
LWIHDWKQKAHAEKFYNVIWLRRATEQIFELNEWMNA